LGLVVCGFPATSGRVDQIKAWQVLVGYVDKIKAWQVLVGYVCCNSA
jgi:hypothetical protein